MTDEQELECDIRLDALEFTWDIKDYSQRDMFMAGFEAALAYMEDKYNAE